MSKPVSDWNMRDMTDYLIEKHREVFGFEYRPFGSWTIERSMITKVFGNGRQDGLYPKELFPYFVDEIMETYQPNDKYPSTNFGFAAKYQGEKLLKAKEKMEQTLEDENKVEPALDDGLDAWLNS